MARIPQQGPIHLGLDVHRNTISIATLLPACASAEVEQIPSDETAVLAFVGRFPEPSRLRVCYEAGPTGYELARLLHRQGVACQVIAPSLIPRAAGDKVKTDRRDSRRLARLHRAGELVAIRIPTAREEAVRDLCRARADLVDDRSRARRRLQAFLLRHGRVYRAGACWTGKHQRWLGTQQFDDRQLQATFAHYRAVAATRDAQVTAIEADLADAATQPPFADAVARLAAYRGVGQLGALSLAAEVGDRVTLRPPGRVHGLHRAGALRALLSRQRLAGPHHPHRQQTSTLPAGGVRLVLPSPSPQRRRPPGTPAPRRARHPGPLLGGAAAPVPTVPPTGAPQAHQRRGRGRRRSGTCRIPVGRDARLTCMPPTPGRSPIGVTAPAAARTRRSTADAGKIPATLLPRPRRRDASSLGPRPAHSRLAVPTREHQSGGPPIHAAPTRSWPTSARPPPGPPAQQGNTGAAHRRLPT